MEGQVVVHHHFLVGHVVRHNAHDLDRQSPDPPAIEQVVQAMAEIRHQQQNLHAFGGVMDCPDHPECRCDGIEPFHQILARCPSLGHEGHADKEHARQRIVELVAVGDVAAVRRQKT